MNASEALSRLQGLRVPAVSTADAASVLRISLEAASHTLRRLAGARLVTPIRKGFWALGEEPDPLVLAGYATAPYPSYVSLQTALYRHGMIEQIPAMIYLASLGRSGLVKSTLGTYSVHHLQPACFDGYETLDSGIRIATPEKALIDFFYLSPASSRLFARLPELVLPPRFQRRVAREWVARIPSQRMRTVAGRRLEEALRSLKPAGVATRP